MTKTTMKTGATNAIATGTQNNGYTDITLTTDSKRHFKQAAEILACDLIRLKHARRVADVDFIEEIRRAYYSMNKVITLVKSDYETLYNNNRDEFITIVVESLLTIDVYGCEDKKEYYRKLKNHIARNIKKELKTESDKMLSHLVMHDINKTYKALRETVGKEEAKKFYSNFSAHYRDAYQALMIPSDLIEFEYSYEPVENEAITTVLLDSIENHASLTPTERETIRAIRYGTFTTGREDANNRKKLERLVKKAKMILSIE